MCGRHAISLSLTHTHTISLAPRHTHTLSLSLSLSLSLTHTHTLFLSHPDTHSLSLYLSRTDTLSLSLSHTLSLSLGQVAPLAFVEEFLVKRGEKRRAFALDKDLFDVLVFPARTDLHDNALIVSGEVWMQDKASCLCAHVLTGGGTIPLRVALDPCAAPGNPKP